MNILLVGNGAREHALAWRLRRSASVRRIVCPNGNPGIATVAETPSVRLDDVRAWADYALAGGIDLVVVGPEGPLVEGIADAMQDRGLAVFGPSREAARLEGSKEFAKEVMREAGVPQARGAAFSDLAPARDFARSLGLPVVIKADGLAAGKGVTVATTWEEAEAALSENLVERRFGAASGRVVVEEYLVGEEASLLALCDGESVYPLAPAEDYKRLRDGDEGPNTGGMGAAAPSPVLGEEDVALAYSDIFLPVVAALRARDIVYRGVLYAGLMVTASGPKVLEFNCRFGDPETQVLMPLLEGDLGEALLACAEGRLGPFLSGRGGGIGFSPDSALCTVLASEGYPEAPVVGRTIRGMDGACDGGDFAVFHAGTRRGPDGTLLTAGGRVLCVTAWSSGLAAARERVRQVAAGIEFDGMIHRRDIGSRALRKRG